MRFAVWAYFALFLLSAVYAAPRFNARAGSDEGSPSEPPSKKIKLEPGTQAVKQESPTVKSESVSPAPMNPREVVHISFIDKGKLKGEHLFEFEQRDKDLLEALIRRAAREKWGWTEDRSQNMAFEYPELTRHYTGIRKRYFFTGPFQQCGERDDEECIAELIDFYDKQDPPRGEGSIYLRKKGVKGFIYDKGDKIFSTLRD